MARKKLSKAQREELRGKFYGLLDEGGLDIATASRMMRAILDMDQAEFARWLKLSPNTIIGIERGIGNPQMETLRQIGKPFGLEVAFVRAAARKSVKVEPTASMQAIGHYPFETEDERT